MNLLQAWKQMLALPTPTKQEPSFTQAELAYLRSVVTEDFQYETEEAKDASKMQARWFTENPAPFDRAMFLEYQALKFHYRARAKARATLIKKLKRLQRGT